MQEVTIGVRIYKAEEFIVRCVKSLFEQTYEGLHYLFVNDGTPDRSIQILKCIVESYPKRKNFVKIVNHKTNRGGAAALNTLIDNCCTEWFFMIDSDDWLELNAIELLINKQKESGADIVSSHIIVNEDKIDERYIHPDYSSCRMMLLDILSSNRHHELCGRLFRFSLIKDNGIFVPEGHNIGEDWIVTPKLVYYAKLIALVPQNLYHYNRNNEGSYMAKANNNRSDLYEKNIKTLQMLRVFFKEKKEEEYVESLSSYIVDIIGLGLFCGLESKDEEYYYNILAHKNFLEPKYQKRIWQGRITKYLKNSYSLSLAIYSIKKKIASWI